MLAARLGNRLALPSYDLDTVAYHSGQKQDLVQRHTVVAHIAERPTWVVEGIYLGWCDILAERATQIVWLDVPWRVAAYRIVRRHVLLSLTGTNPHPGLGRLARFAWATRRYYLARPQAGLTPVDETDDGAITRAATQLWLKRYRNMVIRCRTTTDIDKILFHSARGAGIV